MDGFQESLAALADGTQCGVVPDEGHAAMTQSAEIADGFLDPFAVVHAGVGNILLRRAHIIECRRNPTVGNGLDQMLFHFRNDHCQARHAKTNHQLHAGEEVFGAIVSIGNNDFEPLRVSVRFKGAIDVQEEGFSMFETMMPRMRLFPPASERA